MPSTLDLVSSLRSDVCPPHVKQALYDRIGSGYEKAIDQAMFHLGVTEFQLPKSK